MTFDPYEPPTANLDAPARSADNAGDVPASVIAILADTRPWLRLMVGAFVAGLVLAAIMIGVVFIGSARFSGKSSAFALGMLIPGALVCLIYVPPVLYLSRFASGIRRLQDGGGLPALEQALSSQKSFWKYLGILFLVVVALYAIVFLARILGSTPR
jgi:hypothetical protein